MKNKRQLAKAIARHIFEAGEHKGIKVHRIGFIAKEVGLPEWPLGGLIESSLSGTILCALEDFKNNPQKGA